MPVIYFLIVACSIIYFKNKMKKRKDQESDQAWYDSIKKEIELEPVKVLKVILKNEQEIDITFQANIVSLFCGAGYCVKEASKYMGDWISDLHTNGFAFHNNQKICLQEVKQYVIA